MKKLIVLSLALLLVAAVGGCKEKPKHRKEQAKVYHLSDGRYAYKHHDAHNGDVWFWLYMTSNNGSHDYYRSTSSSFSGPPAGATWVSARSAPTGVTVEPEPNPTEVAEIAQIDATNAAISETIVTDARGMPEVDADGNVVDVDQLAPDAAFDAPADGSDIGASGSSTMGESSDSSSSSSSSDSSSSSSSDSGSSSSSDSGSSGGDSGGGGGDGGGGGGGD